MGRDIFQSLEGYLEHLEREHYEPGKESYSAILGQQYAQSYIDGEFDTLLSFAWAGQSFWNKCVDTLKNWMERWDEDGFEHQEFLDSMVYHLSTNPKPDLPKRMQDLLDTTIQALYSLDYNCFFLNLSLLEEIDGIGRRLQGTPGRPLELSCYAEHLSYLGSETGNCTFSLSGSADSLGYKAVSSIYTVDGIVNEAGKSAHNSDFHLTEFSCVSEIGAGNTYHIYTLPGEDEHTKKLLSNMHTRFSARHFWSKGNKLYFPKGDDWEEVLPE